MQGLAGSVRLQPVQFFVRVQELPRDERVYAAWEFLESVFLKSGLDPVAFRGKRPVPAGLVVHRAHGERPYDRALIGLHHGQDGIENFSGHSVAYAHLFDLRKRPKPLHLFPAFELFKIRGEVLHELLPGE